MQDFEKIYINISFFLVLNIFSISSRKTRIFIYSHIVYIWKHILNRAFNKLLKICNNKMVYIYLVKILLYMDYYFSIFKKNYFYSKLT